jgi:Outer membrane protein beta-barrel domain
MLQMKMFVTAVLATAAMAVPASAMDFSIYGSYWDTDVAGDTAGGGISMGVPFNNVLALDLRATYFEELSGEPLGNAFDSNDPVFRKQGLNVTPLSLGLRVNFGADQRFRPYASGGLSYFLLDSDFGEVNDEVGYYGALGAAIGNPDGVSFFAEAIYRSAEGEVKLDPEELADIRDISVRDHATFDLDGVGVNAGLRLHF